MRGVVLAAACTLGISQMTLAEAPLECRPNLGVGGLLGGMNIGPSDGRIALDPLYAFCLPKPGDGTAHFPYHPYEGAKLTSTVRSAGEAVATYVWYATRVGNTWEMARYETVGGKNPPLAPGEYDLEFAAEGQPFFRFPFAVAKLSTDDPYAPAGEIFRLEGPWRSLANLYYQRNDPQSSIAFALWLEGRSTVPKPKPVNYEARIVRLGDGAVVGVDNGRFRLEPRWQKAELLFRPAGEEGKNQYLKARDLLSRDGEYRFELSVDEKPYGSYRIAVRDGRFAQTPDPTQLTEDRLTTLHHDVGKYRSWWLLRE